MRAMTWIVLPALVVGSVASAQKPAEPAKTEKPASATEPANRATLEDLLATALQHSPEVQMAEAKLREAEAQLRATRLQIAQRLIDLHTSSETQQKNLTLAESEYKRMMKMREAGTVSASEFVEVERKFQTLKGQIAQLEASVGALTGRLPALVRLENAPHQVAGQGMVVGGGGGGGMGLGAGGGLPEPPEPRWPRRSMADKMFKSLEKTISKVEKFDNVPLSDVIEFIRQQSKEVPILANLGAQAETGVRIDFKGELSLGAFFQVLIDTVPDLKIQVRDYGFLVTFAGTEPNDGLSVVEFWKEYENRFMPPQ